MEHVALVKHINDMIKPKRDALHQLVSDNKFYKSMVAVLIVLYIDIQLLIKDLVRLIHAMRFNILKQMEDVRNAQLIQDHKVMASNVVQIHVTLVRLLKKMVLVRAAQNSRGHHQINVNA